MLGTIGCMSTTPPPGFPTDPYGTPYDTRYAGATSPLPLAPPPPPERPRRRAGLAAVALTSLLVGGAAGVGGAATWDAVQDDAPRQSSSVTTAPVLDQGDEPAGEGTVEQVAAVVLPSVVKIDVATQEGSGSG